MKLSEGNYLINCIEKLHALAFKGFLIRYRCDHNYLSPLSKKGMSIINSSRLTNCYIQKPSKLDSAQLYEYLTWTLFKVAIHWLWNLCQLLYHMPFAHNDAQNSQCEWSFPWIRLFFIKHCRSDWELLQPNDWLNATNFSHISWPDEVLKATWTSILKKMEETIILFISYTATKIQSLYVFRDYKLDIGF